MKSKLKKIIMLLCGVLFLCCHSAQKKTGTLAFISVDEELELSKSLSFEASRQLKLLRNQTVLNYFNQIGREIGLQSDWNGLTYTVNILNEPDLNHFSLPGGKIFIYRGIIDSSETASEVALIIAHEIAHIAARNGVHRVAQKYGYAFAAQSLIGEIPEIASQIISQLYSEGSILDYPADDEYLADQKAIKYAWKANYDPSGLLQILKKIRETESTSREKTLLLNKTHPSTSSRYKKARMEVIRAPQKDSLRKNLDDFILIKELMQKIPQ